MKLKRWLFGIMVISIIVLTALAAQVQAASVQNFTISNFTADYYLTKSDQGVGNLHVKETIVADFPDSDQNHGLTRSIPRTNQGGTNRTVDSQSDLHLTVTRNGNAEPINKIEETDNEYLVYIGNNSQYVHGTQTYVLEYDFTDVITEFDADGQNISGQNGAVAWQELYWDTNGTGWQQPIAELTANLHLQPEAFANLEQGRTLCVVGTQGASGQSAASRCTTEPTSDGYTFSTKKLNIGENLTFSVAFKPNTFNVILENDYTFVIIVISEIVIGGAVLLYLFYRWRKKAQPNYKLYKSSFVTTEYLPPKNLSVAEAQQLYTKRVKSTYVATLLELAVQRKVTIKSLSDKNWSVILNVTPDSLTAPERDMLNIIAYRTPLAQGVEIPIERHYSNPAAQQSARDYLLQSYEMAAEKGYLTPNNHRTKNILSFCIILAIIIVSIGICVLLSSMSDSLSPNAHVVGGTPLGIIAVLLFIGLIVGCVWFGNFVSKYSKYTEKGIKMARYLDGLKQYIEFAEDKRLAFIQSVKGADTSTAGLVHLYEKLLPWACLFGTEKSWAAALEKYYKVLDQDGTHYDRIYSYAMMSSIISGNMTSRINSVMASASSSSSSSSGSGGGGFSGGGGGGGGGGGW